MQALIIVTLSGISTEVKPVWAKAAKPIYSTVFAMVTLVNSSLPSKAEL